MLEELFQSLLPVLPTFILIIIGYAANRLSEEFKMNQYLVDCIRAVEKAVNITAQRYTSELKDKNGSLTKQEQIIALEMAKEAFLEEMGESVVNIIEAVFGEFSEWFQNSVDGVLGSNKR